MLWIMKKSKTVTSPERIAQHRSAAWAFTRAATWGAVATIALGIGHRAAGAEKEKLTQHPDRDPVTRVMPHTEGSYTKTVNSGEAVLDTAMLVALGLSVIAAAGAAKETAQFEHSKVKHAQSSGPPPAGPELT